MLAVPHGGFFAVAKGWVFYWEDQYYYVGAADAPTARKYLRKQHLRAAQHARYPQQVADVLVAGMQLNEGTIRVSRANQGGLDG